MNRAPTYLGDLMADPDGRPHQDSALIVATGKDMSVQAMRDRLENLPVIVTDNDDMKPTDEPGFQISVAAVRSENKFQNNETFQLHPKLFGIARAGNGTDNLTSSKDDPPEYPEADANNVLILNAPEGSRNGVAEMALAHTLTALKNISRSTDAYQESEWLRKDPAVAPREMRELTVGVLGSGGIGQKFMQMCAALGTTEFYHYDRVTKGDIQVGTDSSGKPVYAKQKDIDYVIGKCDVVSIHTGGKEMLISPDEIAKMKRGGVLINTSRANNMDYDAASQAAIKGDIFFGVDVSPFEKNDEKFEEETVKLLQEAARANRATITHHQSANSPIAKSEVLDDTADRIRHLIEIGTPLGAKLPLNLRNPSEVSIGRRSEPGIRLVATHPDKDGAHHQITGILTDQHISFGNCITVGDGNNDSKIAQSIIDLPSTVTSEGAIKVMEEIKRLNSAGRVRLLVWG